ncbi:MAG: eukaryotic-like serine/threonine-protein kinase [Gaiellaceae bacterium]|jgi:serine/threonine-protein kinase|nr:eukaryotic-like serine/threonine-protein kinase [Gaiellaceae bacterium]
MADVPPRDPRDPADDETVIVPPDDQWGPEDEVFVEQVEQVEQVPPRRPIPTIWPWLLALLVLVLAGLAAAYFLTRDDNEAATTTSAPTATTAPATTTSTTAALVRVPDVVGTTSSEATKALRDAGFDVNVVAVPSDQPPGTVVAQRPAAGGEAEKGSTVRINVARQAAGTTTSETTAPTTTTEPTTTTAPSAPQPATVPDVVGQELADAARTFAEQGLKVSVQYVPSNEAAGRVIAQAQPAGTERKRGDTVQVNVSVGAQPAAETSVPDVVGRTNEQARQALVGAGFEVLALNLQASDVRREDKVGSQTPAAGATVPRGSLVILYLTS